MSKFFPAFVMVTLVLVAWHFIAAFIPGVAAFVRI